MRKIFLSFTAILAFSCSSTKVSDSSQKPLYEILLQRDTGGAQVRFFEILSQEDEFLMIKNDPELKNEISANDIQTANFIILSAGEKNTGGYAIGIEKVTETDKNIIVKVKETGPKPGENVTMAITTPYAVIRINSKKDIIIE